LIDHHPLLARHGFRIMRAESAWRGLLTSELWALEGAAPARRVTAR
jgi:hypothetical protein